MVAIATLAPFDYDVGHGNAILVEDETAPAELNRLVHVACRVNAQRVVFLVTGALVHDARACLEGLLETLRIELDLNDRVLS